MWKDVAGTRTYFFYSDEGLIAEYDESGNELKSYGYQPDSTWTTDPLFLKQNGSYYFYQNAHLGTPQKLMAQNGAVVWSASYSAFGEATIQVETITNNLRFPGQYYDAETGLHYNYHRYYDPKIGRYVSADPIGFTDGEVNWYGYALNNPIRAFDPFGLQCHKVRLIFNADHYKDAGTFDGAAAHLEDAYNRSQEKDVTVIREFARDGRKIVEIINQQEKDSIISLDIFSHGNPFGIHISRKFEKEGKEPVPHWPSIPTEPVPNGPYIPEWAPVRPGSRANPWGVVKPWLHTWIRDLPEEDGREMEESYHGLYTDIFGALAVGVYFNQQWGEGIATLSAIDFSHFSEDAKVELHACQTARDYAITFGPVTILWNTNFAYSFSLWLGGAGKTQAEVTGHVPKVGIKGQSYQHGHRRVYQNGEIIRELH